MGYKKYNMDAIVSVSPIKLEGKLEEIIFNQICNDFEGVINKDVGLVLAVTDLIEYNEGEIVPGDPNVFYKVRFSFVSFMPKLHEVMPGVVTQATDFGAFIKIGPFEGLCHISQIMEDFNSYNPDLPGFVGKESKQMLKVEDLVNTRIANVSLKSTITETKIGLTMRQLGLGKEDWIVVAEKEKKKKEKTAKEKKTKTTKTTKTKK
jgi:DNA-directed RNA polymerase subunit E'